MGKHNPDNDYVRADEKPRRNFNKEGCFMRCTKKIFMRLYPAQKKHAWTKQGQWLRTMLGTACAAHILFFVVALAFVGFQTMLVNLVLASWSYSVYLTLNQCSVFLYIFFLMAATFIGLFYSMG